MDSPPTNYENTLDSSPAQQKSPKSSNPPTVDAESFAIFGLVSYASSSSSAKSSADNSPLPLPSQVKTDGKIELSEVALLSEPENILNTFNVEEYDALNSVTSSESATFSTGGIKLEVEETSEVKVEKPEKDYFKEHETKQTEKSLPSSPVTSPKIQQVSNFKENINDQDEENFATFDSINDFESIRETVSSLVDASEMSIQSSKDDEGKCDIPESPDRKRMRLQLFDDYSTDSSKVESPLAISSQVLEQEGDASNDSELQFDIDAKIQSTEPDKMDATSSIAADLTLSPSPPSSPSLPSPIIGDLQVNMESVSMALAMPKINLESTAPSIAGIAMPSLSTITLEATTAPLRPILSIKLPDVMHSSEQESRKDPEIGVSAKSSILFQSNLSKDRRELSFSDDDNQEFENTAHNSRGDGNFNDDGDEMEDEHDLLKALTGASGGGDRNRSGCDDHGIDDDDDSMDDDSLVDGRNRAEDLEFKTSFGLNLFGTGKDTNTILSDRDPKMLTKYEQERLKEKLQVEERERMQ